MRIALETILLFWVAPCVVAALILWIRSLIRRPDVTSRKAARERIAMAYFNYLTRRPDTTEEE